MRWTRGHAEPGPRGDLRDASTPPVLGDGLERRHRPHDATGCRPASPAGQAGAARPCSPCGSPASRQARSVAPARSAPGGTRPRAPGRVDAAREPSPSVRPRERRFAVRTSRSRGGRRRRREAAPWVDTSCRSRVRRTSRTRSCTRSRMPTIDHRGPEFQALGQRVLEKLPRVVRHDRAGGDLPGLGHRGLGGRAGQHAQPRRQGAVLRDRPLRHAVGAHGRRARPRRRGRARRLAARRRPGASCRSASPPTPPTRSRPSASSTTRPRPASPAGSARCAQAIDARRPPRAAARRHHLLARLDRLPARRVGRRRHRRRLAEGAHAPAGAELQRGERQGARGLAPTAQLPPLVLGLGADPRGQRERLLALHPRHQPAVRPRRRARHALRRGPGERLRPPPAARRGHPRGGARAGASSCCASTSASTPARSPRS